MFDNRCLDLSNWEFDHSPFPHGVSPGALQDDVAQQLYEWFEKTAEWELTKTDFYEQYEFNFLHVMLPPALQRLVSAATIEGIQKHFRDNFGTTSMELVGVMAHKLLEGQRIGIHNDYINGAETHRLVIHINPLWKQENGGYLMLFHSESERDVAKVFSPIVNFGFGFEISANSYHAVSRIHDFTRYTLIYTFKNC
jgi:Rps23 Pro-64 3,4-dihydroxylase Tpa1-like proline 4-hydroxylase